MIRPILLGLALATITAAPAVAADAAKKEAKQELHDNRITKDEAKVLRAYYKFERKSDKVAGVKTKDNLPDGWAKKLSKGWTLPPEILAASNPVPPDVVAKLGKQPANTKLVEVRNQRVIRIDGANKVQDVIDLTPNN